MPSDIGTIRNIGIVAHIDAGKTTTTERILFYTGASHRMGDVDQGTTITDFDPDEARRGITIYSAAITCKWQDTTINIIDTPGHVDFTAEVERSLRVLDGAVVIFSAVEGVEAQSETVWRQSDRYHVPRICFINKLDRIGADFERTFHQIADRLRAHPIAVQIPIGTGAPGQADALRGVVDLVEMKALYFDPDSQGSQLEVTEIPDNLQESAERWRQRLMEAVSMLDDDIMEQYLGDAEAEEIAPDDIHRVLRAATLQGLLQPTFCGASLDYIGVQPLLDGVVRYLPSPLEVPPVEGDHPNPKKDTQVRNCDPAEPFCGLVFKIVADQHADLCYLRVYSGRLRSGDRVLNPRSGKKEQINQLWRVQADSREKLEENEVSAGDIVGFVGPKNVVTGDTLCDAQRPILLEPISFPETVISMAVEPDSNAERRKLAETLERLGRQDPTFTAHVSDETGQTIISGMGELHLEVIRQRMERDFKLKVRVHKPRVSYRETIQKRVEAEGSFQRQSAGESHFARVRLSIEPFQGEESTDVRNKIKPGTMPQALMDVLQAAVADEIRGGGVVGYPLMKVRLTLLDADYREAETDDAAIQWAAKDAFRKALQDAGPALLEPIMSLEVVTPEESLGNIQADLNARRAIIVNSERSGDLCVVQAEAPLSKMFGYSTQVRSLSQGRASYSMEPLKYDAAPPDVLRDMLG